ILAGDTLLYPKFKEKNSIKKFDYAIANPPWNQDNYGEENLKTGELWKERFSFGFATSQSADWIWIQHMFASIRDTGKLAVVIDTGSVSRGGKEKLIRQKFIENDFIEAVILLPEKLFYNTGAPAVVLVLVKQKEEHKKGKILLINASKEYQPGKKQNTLTQQNIDKIVETYRNFKEVEKLSKIITLKDAADADYNLSPSRFVFIAEEENYRPIEEIKKELEELEKERKDVEEKLKSIFKSKIYER
ncbi:MAG: SAM-dependent methyltransferase, partial [Candidatus Pacearchaeota archaeon]|nr:SAM-dependent methyltransferase [Candidatus Pacearchaeota archaeon]